MNSDKDFIEPMLRGEYIETLDAMRFTEVQKARMAINIAAGATRKKGVVVKREKTRRAFPGIAIFGKPATAVAVIAICLVLPITALAASGALKGFFVNITDYRGAIVGQTYEQATDEIDMSAVVNGDQITAVVVFEDPEAPPYNEAEKLGIAEYRILGADGKSVKEGCTESVEVVDGQAAISLRMDGIDHGDYVLVVTALVSEKKADQPLNISGNWECRFTW